MLDIVEKGFRNTSKNHHLGTKITTDYLLSKWKNGEWLNNFVTTDVATRKSSTNFPSVDREFDDSNTKAIISCEFKPSTESKRGVLTGLGQAIAYLNSADAAYLICPSMIDDFNMESFLKDTFKKSITNKLPVGLIVFDGGFNEYKNIRLTVDISDDLRCSNRTLKRGGVSPWAIWRDNPTIGIVRLLESCSIKTNKNIDERWAYFFNNYYAPPKVRNTFDLVANDFYMFDPDGNYQIPFSTLKNTIKDYFEKKLTYEQIKKLDRYQGALRQNGERGDDRFHYLEGLPQNSDLTESDFLKLLANHCWEPNVTENLYQNYKKNYKNFIVHLNLCDLELKTTKLGDRFVKRCIAFIDSNDDIYQQSENINNELAQILLVSGKHHDLIIDLLDAQLAIPETDTLETILKKFVKYFDAKGFLPRNANRATSGNRQFLQAEKQIWGHLNLIKKDLPVNDNLLHFDMHKINILVDEFYENYGDVYNTI